MKITKINPILRLVNEFLIDSPAPSNLHYLWDFGSLLGFNLVLMIVTGIAQAMHYNPSTAMAFNSVEHHDVFVNFIYMLIFFISR